MILRKWNYRKNKYEPYEISNDWNCKIFSENMEEIINCVHCGKKIKLGDSYNSMEVQADLGFRYAVCEKCYHNEWIRRENNES